MSPPRVTIAISVHDQAGYLAEALDGFAAQSFADVEVVVVPATSRAPVALARSCLVPPGQTRSSRTTGHVLGGSTGVVAEQVAGERRTRKAPATT